jgi:hypothetical protein
MDFFSALTRCETCSKVCGVVGALYLASWVLTWCNWLYLNFVASVNLKSRYKKVGDWAVVTGASDGIGKDREGSQPR